MRYRVPAGGGRMSAVAAGLSRVLSGCGEGPQESRHDMDARGFRHLYDYHFENHALWDAGVMSLTDEATGSGAPDRPARRRPSAG